MDKTQDVSSLWWTYNNNKSITAHYHFSPTPPQHIPSLVPHVEVTMVTADEEGDMENNFNYESVLSYDCNNVRDMRSIECGSEDIREQFIVNCKLTMCMDASLYLLRCSYLVSLLVAGGCMIVSLGMSHMVEI